MNEIGLLVVDVKLIGCVFMVEVVGYEFVIDMLCVLKMVVYLVLVFNKFDEFVVIGQLSVFIVDQFIQKVCVIDWKVIDVKGVVNFWDFLNMEFNIWISQDQVLGSGLLLQGFFGQNVKILIDGVLVIGWQNGEIDLSQINFVGIECIEIIEGFLSVKYGSDVLVGIINFILKKQLVKGMKVVGSIYYEFIGNYNVDLLFFVMMKYGMFQVYGQCNYFDGWLVIDLFFSFF